MTRVINAKFSNELQVNQAAERAKSSTDRQDKIKSAGIRITEIFIATDYVTLFFHDHRKGLVMSGIK